MRKIATIAVISILVLCKNQSVQASDGISIEVRPLTYTSGSRKTTSGRILIRITPDADNRAIKIELDSDAACLSSTSEFDLDGDRAAKIIERFVEFECGNYTVKVEITRANNRPKARAIQIVRDASTKSYAEESSSGNR